MRQRERSPLEVTFIVILVLVGSLETGLRGRLTSVCLYAHTLTPCWLETVGLQVLLSVFLPLSVLLTRYRSILPLGEELGAAPVGPHPPPQSGFALPAKHCNLLPFGCSYCFPYSSETGRNIGQTVFLSTSTQLNYSSPTPHTKDRQCLPSNNGHMNAVCAAQPLRDRSLVGVHLAQILIRR